jgi:predicted O-methyltransferase YrrM
VGYPAWNLLFYSALCSLDPNGGEVVVVETGTNQGFSTIVLAQAIEDSGAGGVLHTVDFSGDMTTRARKNVERAGVTHRVVFHTGDSVEVVRSLMAEVERVDFAFLDASHAAAHVFAEFRLLYPKLVASRAKVYFDNSREGGVHDALFLIRRAFGGNMVHFDECSWSPPGACIWQSG